MSIENKVLLNVKNKVSVKVVLNREAQHHASILSQSTDADSLEEIISEALAVHYAMVTALQNGSRIIVADEAGEHAEFHA